MTGFVWLMNRRSFGRVVEASEEVVVDVDVDVLGDAAGAVAEEAAYIFDPEAGLVQRPGGRTRGAASGTSRPSRHRRRGAGRHWRRPGPSGCGRSWTGRTKTCLEKPGGWSAV